MHPEVQELAELLEKTQALLTKCGEEHWSAWLSKDSRLIRKFDLYGVEHFLSAFGGMGSINDLVLHPLNGHQVQECEIDAANTELRALLNKSYALANEFHAEEVSGSKIP